MSKGTQAPIDPEYVRVKLFEYAIEYYCCARFAATGHLMFATGSMFHHTAELLLKSHLVRKVSPEVLKRDFSHGLRKLWEAFKAEFPGEDLTSFDPLVSELDDWWKIRYPDDLIRHGGRLGIGWDTPGMTGEQGGAWAKPVPKYDLCMRNMDRFLARVVSLLSHNPRAVTPRLRQPVLDILLRDNPDIEGWFPQPQ